MARTLRISKIFENPNEFINSIEELMKSHLSYHAIHGFGIDEDVLDTIYKANKWLGQLGFGTINWKEKFGWCVRCKTISDHCRCHIYLEKEEEEEDEYEEEEDGLTVWRGGHYQLIINKENYMSEAASEKQQEAIIKIMSMWHNMYNDGETLEEFIENFFSQGGEVLVPQDLPVNQWLFSTRLVPPTWLELRAGTAEPLPSNVILNED
jgi:hypothetical protein